MHPRQRPPRRQRQKGIRQGHSPSILSAVEPQLIPLNVLLALCSGPRMLYPATLFDSGYRLAGIETPVSSGDDKVVVDVVMFQSERNMALAGEAKSGSNIDEDQARRYKRLDVDAVIQSASISITTPGTKSMQSLYCCPSDKADRVLIGLEAAELSCPVLAFDDVAIENRGGTFMDPALQDAFREPVRTSVLPPRIISVDEDSPVESFEKLVMAALVRELSWQRSHISVSVLAEQALSHLAIYGTPGRNRLVKKVDKAARAISERISDWFEYQPRTERRDHAMIRILKSPEDAALQGRTQGYQALGRLFHKEASGMPQKMPPPNQAKLFDNLMDEIEQIDPTADPEDQ